MRLLYPIYPILAVLFAYSAAAQNISTIAGNGLQSYSGNNISAVYSQLFKPNGITFDASGNLYIADQFNQCIRKISTTGVITTIAGTTFVNGFSGDGGPATAALFKYPAGVAIDGAGNIFIADKENNRIRKITGGTITTFAGTGAGGYFGDGSVASTTTTVFNGPSGIAIDAVGNMYISDRYNHAVRKISTSGMVTSLIGRYGTGYFGDGGPSTAGAINEPTGVAVDNSGNVYIADYGNNCVRKINSSGIITTLAGNGITGYSGDGGPASVAQLANPFAVRTDLAGNVYISDNGNSCLRIVNTSGIINTIAGTGNAGFSGDGGLATNAMLYEPQGIAINTAGNIFVADGSWRIRRIAGGLISTYGGGMANGIPATANAINPIAAVVDASGNILIADADNNRICKITPSGTMQTIAGNGADSYYGDGGPATAASFSYPSGICLDNAGNILVADQGNDVIRKISPGGTISTVAGNGSHGYSGDGVPATSSMLSAPTGVIVDISGNMYIADRFNNRVRMVNTAGIISTVAGDTVGLFSDGIPATTARLKGPNGVAVDLKGNIFIAESLNNTIRKVSGGIISTVAGIGSIGFTGDGGPATLAKLNYPTGVAIDTSGNIYIADASNNRCRKVNLLGEINTVAGDTAAKLFGGDGGPATAAHLNFCSNITFDAFGNLYISDYDNFRVRKVLPAALPVIKGVRTLCVAASVTLSTSMPGGTWTSMNTVIAVAGSSSGVITGVAAGTATIIYTISGNTVATTVSVNPLPVPGTITGPGNVCVGASVSLSDVIPGGSWSRKNTTATVSGGMVTGVSAGTNVITYSVSNTCGTAYTTFPITVDPLPTAGTISGPSGVCIGSSVTISSTVSGGIWTASNTNLSVAGGVVIGNSAGNDTISYTVTTTCGTANTTRTMTINPLPVSGTISGATNVCVSSVLTLTDMITGGLWSCTNSNATVTGGLVTGVSGGVDTVLYAVTNVCGTATASYSVTINPLPSPISGSAGICKGLSAVLSDATPIGLWSSSLTSVATIGPASGIVNATATGTTTISYTLTATGCYTTRIVTVYPLPVIFSVTGGGSYCAGGAGVHVGLSGSSAAIQYQLYNGPTGVGSPYSGTGIKMDFGAFTPAGIYSVSATDAATGCTSGMAGSSTITINPLPSPISGVSSVCEGSTTNVSDATTGGTWSSGNTAIAAISPLTGTVTGIVAGTTFVTYTLSTGCMASLVFTVDPLPDAGTISGPPTVCLDSAVIITATNPGGIWAMTNALASVNSSGVVTANTIGLDTVLYTVSGICGSASAMTTLSVIRCIFTGVDPVEIEGGELKIWPNPCSDMFNAELLYSGNRDITFIVYNMLGQRVLEVPARTNESATFNTSLMSPGLYRVSVTGTGYGRCISVIH